MTAWDLPRGTLPPIWKSIGRPVADDLRSALAGLPDGVPVEELSGFEVSWLLMGEGQTPPNPYLADALARHSRSRGRPVAFLITEKEIREQFWRPRDPVALNNTIDEPKIAFLLDVRRRVGPIGAHLEQLYRARRERKSIDSRPKLPTRAYPIPRRLSRKRRLEHWRSIVFLGCLTPRMLRPPSWSCPSACSREKPECCRGCALAAAP
jgi:hypothetical protein